MRRRRSEIRLWSPSERLAVVDVPAEDAGTLGGLRQQRVRGTISEADFVSNVMLAGGGPARAE